MAERKSRGVEQVDQPLEELSYEEANNRYPHEWILLEVTRTDEHHVITHGHVLEHNSRRKQISRALDRFWERHPRTPVAIFVGGTRRVSGDEFRNAIAEAAKRPYVNAHW